MKHSIRKYFAAVLLLGLPLVFTSCGGSLDDIFGEWDSPSAVEEAKVLGAALEKGAKVTITYTVGSTTYTATFEKGDGDNYTLISNTSGAGARAMTRAATPGTVPEGAGTIVGDKIRLVLEGGKLKLIVEDEAEAPLFVAQFKIETGETTVINTNALGISCAVSTFVVNEVKKDIEINVMKGANVSYDYKFQIESSDYHAEFGYVFLYDEEKGETWADMIARYKNNSLDFWGSTDDGFITISITEEAAIEVIKGIPGLSASDGLIEEFATTVSMTKLYLYTKEEVNMSARAMTRMRTTYKYTPVKSTDLVDCYKNYILSPAIGHALTSASIGEIIGSDGRAYSLDYKNDLSSIGVKAVAMVAYVGSETGEADYGYTHGLALALSDANNGSASQWKTSADDAGHTKQGFSTFTTESGLQYNDTHNSATFPAFKAAISNNSTSAPTGCSDWFLPTGFQWNQMVNACKNVLSNNNNSADLRDGFTSVGGTNLQSYTYWSSTEYDSESACFYNFYISESSRDSKTINCYVRACLAF